MKASLSVLNCRWSLENERSFKYWGGVLASPVAKAVLDAIGKAYIVEFGTSGEDKIQNDNVTSSIYYVVFSNGFVIQCQSMLNRDMTITFPIEFADTKYCLLGVGLDIHQVGGQYYERSTTGFTTHSITKGTNTRTWIACGYKA